MPLPRSANAAISFESGCKQVATSGRNLAKVAVSTSAADSSAAAADDIGADNDAPDFGESRPWKVELESIMGHAPDNADWSEARPTHAAFH